jgi:two-component system, sensor histidine kinase and response regulator
MDIDHNTPFKILVVDDNPDNIQVLGNMLREAGYQIGFATDGRQALNLLQKSVNYDLVLLDVDMPVMNGYEACRAMRSDENLKDLPVIFLTAFTEVENKITGFEAGAQDYVTKPYHVQELLSRVRTHAELKRNREKLKEVNKWLEVQVKEKTIELENALFELNRLDRLKTNFLFQISEEIKTPLNGIIGTINLVKNEDRSPAVKDMIDILEISLSRLESFVSKAVFSTQLNSKEYPLNLSELNLNELIKYSILDLNNIIQQKNLNISINSGNPIIRINADKDLVFRALSYLLDNAVKFSAKNSEIVISLDEIDSNVVVSITDKGSGFTSAELSNLLSDFGQDSDITGTKIGISLQIIKQIMDLHEGSITIANLESGGACVKLFFNPLKR